MLMILYRVESYVNIFENNILHVFVAQFPLISYVQSIPKRCIHKVNIPDYIVYTSFWVTLYFF
jgi:hypothetical protein